MNSDAGTRSCPYCKEEIKADAVRCKHCRSDLAPERPSHGGACPYCKESIHPEAIKCRHCGSMLGPERGPAGCAGCGGPPPAMQAANTEPVFESSLPTTPGAAAAAGPRCGPCEYGGMIDPFAGKSYGRRLCCVSVPVQGPGGVTWVRRCWYRYNCPAQSWGSPAGPVIIA